MNRWVEKTDLAAMRFTGWLGVPRSTFAEWRRRYGKVNEHNAWVPRDHWLEESEKRAIVEYTMKHPGEGYRPLAFMMLDEDVAAVSPSSVYRVLKAAGLLERWNRKESKKGTGFVQPLKPHEHWHIDIAHLNLEGVFYYLCAVLDGYSRYVIGWDLLPSMTEADVELIVQRAREAFPGAAPRMISDNGPQFVSRDFATFIREAQMTHVRTSPYYPQSNGKMERCFKTCKGALRLADPATIEAARRAVDRIIRHYNQERLHAAIGYVTPMDKLAGRETAIFEARDRKLEAARDRRAKARAQERTRIEQEQERDRNGFDGRKIGTDPSSDAARGAAVPGSRELAYLEKGLSNSD